MLTRGQWNILNCCADADEPIEQVYANYSEHDQTVDPALLLSDLLRLYQSGLITIRQIPMDWCGQEFAERNINPESPDDIVGDLRDSFDEFRRKREWLCYEQGGQYTGPSGIPFGIWIDMTPAGRAEWERREYQVYWPDPTS